MKKKTKNKNMKRRSTKNKREYSKKTKRKNKKKTKRKYSKKKQKMKGGSAAAVCPLSFPLNTHIKMCVTTRVPLAVPEYFDWDMTFRYLDATVEGQTAWSGIGQPDIPTLNQKELEKLAPGEIIWASTRLIAAFETFEIAKGEALSGHHRYDNAIGIWRDLRDPEDQKFAILMRPSEKETPAMLTEKRAHGDQRQLLWRIKISNQRDKVVERKFNAGGGVLTKAEAALTPRILYSVINIGSWERSNLPHKLVSVKDMKPNPGAFLIRDHGFCYVDMGNDNPLGFGTDLLNLIGGMGEGGTWPMDKGGGYDGLQWRKLVEESARVSSSKAGGVCDTHPPNEGKILILSILSLIGKIFWGCQINNWSISFGVSEGADRDLYRIFYRCKIDIVDEEGGVHKGTEVHVKFVNQQFRSQELAPTQSGTTAAFPTLHTDYGKLFGDNEVLPDEMAATVGSDTAGTGPSRASAPAPSGFAAGWNPNILEQSGYCLINLWVNLTKNTPLYSNSLALMDKRAVNNDTTNDTYNERNHTIISNVDLNKIYTYDGLQYGGGFFFQSRFVPHCSLTHTTDDLRLIGTEKKIRKDNQGNFLRPSELYLNELDKTIDLSDLSKYKENLADMEEEVTRIRGTAPDGVTVSPENQKRAEEVSSEHAFLTARGLTRAKVTRAGETIKKELGRRVRQRERSGQRGGYDAGHDTKRESMELRLAVKIIDYDLHKKYIGGHYFHEPPASSLYTSEEIAAAGKVREERTKHGETLLQGWVTQLAESTGVSREIAEQVLREKKWDREVAKASLVEAAAAAAEAEAAVAAAAAAAAAAEAAEAARPTRLTPIDITGLELDDSVTRGGYRYYNIYVYGTDKRPGSHMNEYEWKVSLRYSELFAFNQNIQTYNQEKGPDKILELTRLPFPQKIYSPWKITPQEEADRQQNLSSYLSGLSEFIPRMVDYPWRDFWRPKSEGTPIVPDNRERRAQERER